MLRNGLGTKSKSFFSYDFNPLMSSVSVNKLQKKNHNSLTIQRLKLFFLKRLAYKTLFLNESLCRTGLTNRGLQRGAVKSKGIIVGY